MRFSTRFKAVIGVLAVLLFALCASASIFQVAPIYPTGTAPTDVVVGDVNGDTIPDLLVASHGGVDVLLGIGDGKFQPAIETALFSRPAKLALADVNGDGVLDLIALQPDSGSIEVLLGDGSGSFHSASVTSVQGFTSAITLGDFDGNGSSDAIIGGVSGLAFLRGNGDGSFQPSIPFGGQIGASVHALASADLNGDGILDLVGVVDQSVGTAVFLGNGDGTFQPGVPHLVTTPINLVIADLNRDGVPDVAVTGGNYCAEVMLGVGDGTFAGYVEYGSGLALSPAAVVVADFDGDGNPDLVVANGFGGGLQNENNITFLQGRFGDGSFPFPATSYGTGFGPVALVAADFNGDGRSDMAAVNQLGNSVSVLLGKSGGFEAVAEYNENLKVVSGGIGDFNNNGKLDVLINQRGILSVQRGNGDGTLDLKVINSKSQRYLLTVVGDVNNDGNLDAVGVLNRPTGTAVFMVSLGQGNGTFTRDFVLFLPFKGNQIPYLADLNHDGNLDLILAGTGITVLLGDGQGKFGNPITYPVPGGTANIAIGDFDHDRKLDVIAVSRNSTVFLKGNGDGSFQPATFVTKATGSIVAADFNNDGNLDFAIGGMDSNSQNAVMIYLGNGKGKFHAPVVSNIQYLAGPIVAADFNGDGNIDVAVVDTQSFVLTALVGKGDGTFSSAQVFPAGYGPLQLLTGDFNGDGLADVAIIGNPTVSILLGNGN